MPIAPDPLLTQELRADVVRFVESRVILPNSHFFFGCRARPSGTVRGFGYTITVSVLVMSLLPTSHLPSLYYYGASDGGMDLVPGYNCASCT